jgi:hypothetical protein
MIVVTGTKRSGTSLWMQILIAGGLPHLGEDFPVTWGASIRDANPRGFYESRLRQGVFYATNPDPRTGHYLSPEAARGHAVKVFIPGVVRSDVAHLHRVVATMRSWRAYGHSIRRLYAREDAWLLENPPEGKTGEEAVAWARSLRSPLPPAVEWFMENYDLLRDFAVRRYPINLSTYERLLEAPGPLVERVFHWLGQGDPEAGLKAIDHDLDRSTGDGSPHPDDLAVLEPDRVRLFDDLHGAIHEKGAVPRSLLHDLNAAWKALREAHGGLSRERGREEVDPA